MADVRVVIRYRKAVTYGVHALMAALEAAGAGCDVRLGATARECADQIAAAAASAGTVLVLWSFYSPDADDMVAELAAVRAATPAAGQLLRALAQAGRALGATGRDGARLPAPRPAPPHHQLIRTRSGTPGACVTEEAGLPVGFR